MNSLMRYNKPFSLINALTTDTFPPFNPFDTKWGTSTSFYPTEEIAQYYVTDDSIIIKAVVPGFGKEDIKSLTYDVKTGYVSCELESKENDVVTTKSFHIAIPKAVQKETFSVDSFEKGILKLSVKRQLEKQEKSSLFKII